jgi:hypothetical protein
MHYRIQDERQRTRREVRVLYAYLYALRKGFNPFRSAYKNPGIKGDESRKTNELHISEEFTPLRGADDDHSLVDHHDHTT